jgi:predicted DNA-binding antitoxin AbrB/MazE fold protein
MRTAESVIHPEANMLGEQIEAVFENGVFRPLTPVDLPEHQRVTLVLPTDEEAFDEEAGYEPLPLRQCKSIRVRLKRVGDFGPIPYPS